MTDTEILRAADKIIRRALAMTEDERERAVFRDTLTGLLWVRADIAIAALPRLTPADLLILHPMSK